MTRIQIGLKTYTLDWLSDRRNRGAQSVTKPLRLDEADELPDFTLHDTTPEFYLKVFGIEDNTDSGLLRFPAPIEARPLPCAALDGAPVASTPKCVR